MTRQVLTEQELLAALNKELSEFDGCADCRFTSVQRIRGVDELGCNWSAANLRCSGQPVDVCRNAADRVLSAARAKYSVT